MLYFRHLERNVKLNITARACEISSFPFFCFKKAILSSDVQVNFDCKISYLYYFVRLIFFYDYPHS